MKKAIWIVIVIIILLLIVWAFAAMNDGDVDDMDTDVDITLEERARQAGLAVTETSILVDLAEQNNSGISGVAVLTELGDAQTEVAVWLDDEAGTPRPAHIHAGTCATIGGVEFPLENVTDEFSNTTIASDFETLEAMGPLSINAHESEALLDNYIACGNINFDQDISDLGEGDDDAAETMTVRYTAEGFVPAEITIEAGDTVTWVNETENDMWVASAMHPTHTVYDGSSLSEHCPDPEGDDFDQCENGDEYSFTFPEAGEWAYHNHSLANHFGRVIVE